MVDTGIATIAEKHAMYFLCSDGYVRAPRRQMRLMRQHNFTNIFPRGAYFVLDRPHFWLTTGAVPRFVHPHDIWAEQNNMLETYPGRVVSVSYDKKDYHLLIELAPNVLAFAEVSSFNGNKDVKFVPYKYNHRTKKIYGCVHNEQTLSPERQLSARNN